MWICTSCAMTRTRRFSICRTVLQQIVLGHWSKTFTGAWTWLQHVLALNHGPRTRPLRLGVVNQWMCLGHDCMCKLFRLSWTRQPSTRLHSCMESSVRARPRKPSRTDFFLSTPVKLECHCRIGQHFRVALVELWGCMEWHWLPEPHRQGLPFAVAQSVFFLQKGFLWEL